MGEIDGEELGESLQDQARVELDDEDSEGMYTSPMGGLKKNDPNVKKTKPERQREEKASSEEEDEDDELELDLINQAQQRHSINREKEKDQPLKLYIADEKEEILQGKITLKVE